MNDRSVMWSFSKSLALPLSDATRTNQRPLRRVNDGLKSPDAFDLEAWGRA